MRKFLFLIIIMIPSLMQAQTERNSTGVKADDTYGYNSILFSGSTMSLFGVKYQYCRSFGGYAALRTDFNVLANDNLITVGVSKSVFSKVNLYLGGGVNLGNWDDEEINLVRDRLGIIAEGGSIIKSKWFAFDIGLGVSLSSYTDYDEAYEYIDDQYSKLRGYLIIGFGYNF
jgi:hypothetical protein